MVSEFISLVKGVDPRLIPKIIAIIAAIAFSVDYGKMKIDYYLENNNIIESDIQFLITCIIIFGMGTGGFYLCQFLYKKYVKNPN